MPGTVCKEHTEKTKEVALLDEAEKKDNVTSIFDRISEKKNEVMERDKSPKSVVEKQQKANKNRIQVI